MLVTFHLLGNQLFICVKIISPLALRMEAASSQREAVGDIADSLTNAHRGGGSAQRTQAKAPVPLYE